MYRIVQERDRQREKPKTVNQYRTHRLCNYVTQRQHELIMNQLGNKTTPLCNKYDADDVRVTHGYPESCQETVAMHEGGVGVLVKKLIIHLK
jgi:hypothetical protein